MSDKKEDKQIEEFIIQSLKDYSLPFTEEEKMHLINEFQHIRTHQNNFNLSFKDFISNKTFQWIVISIAGIILIIYLFANLFPSEKENTTHHNTNQAIQNTDSSAIKDSIQSAESNFNQSRKKDSLHNDNQKSITTNTYTQPATNNNVLNNTNTSAQNKTDSSVSSKNKTEQGNNFTPKKKKKKKKDDTIQEDNSLPVLEPKTPDLNGGTKEEE